MLTWPVLGPALVGVWLLIWKPRKVPGAAPKKTLLLGHRGARFGPDAGSENSLGAFRTALDAGLDGVETDLQTTRDGSIVLYHDYELPDGRRVASLTCAELRAADPAIATLPDLFALAHGYPGTLLNLELKTRGWRTGGLERAAAQAVRASGLEERVLVSSFNPLSLARLRLYAPELRAALLTSPDGPRWLRGDRAARFWMRALHLDALHPHFSAVDAALVGWARQRRVTLNTWTVNNEAEVKRLTRLNVNGLMADDPAALKNAYEEALWSPDPNPRPRRRDRPIVR